MKQKMKLMHYSLIGIKLLFLGLLPSCDEGEKEFLVKSDFVYINTTNYRIDIVTNINPLTIASNSTETLSLSGAGPEVITEDNYVPPFLSGILVFDQTHCDTLSAGSKAGRGEGPAGIQNYQAEELGTRYYQFTYTFIESDFNKATICE